MGKTRVSSARYSSDAMAARPTMCLWSSLWTHERRRRTDEGARRRRLPCVGRWPGLRARSGGYCSGRIARGRADQTNPFPAAGSVGWRSAEGHATRWPDGGANLRRLRDLTGRNPALPFQSRIPARTRGSAAEGVGAAILPTLRAMTAPFLCLTETATFGPPRARARARTMRSAAGTIRGICLHQRLHGAGKRKGASGCRC